ncbi:Uncharacterised protein [Vibrio cholerae]|nr:Uncharacterised protein [Vibrio cholerae]
MARCKPSSSKAATTGCRSTICTRQPKDANTNASRPKPAVASKTTGVTPLFSPAALAIDCPLPPPNLRRCATAPSTQST